MNGEVFLDGQSLLTGGIYVNPGAKLEEKTITENGTYYPSTGKDGFSNVTVNVPQPQPVLASINIEENGTYTPPEGTDGYNNIKVEVPQPQPVYEELDETITVNGEYTYNPSSGKDGFSSAKITVNVPAPTVTLQDKTVTSNGTYTADEGYNGLGTVAVNVPGNTYLCKNLPVTAHDGTNLGAVTLPNALTINKRYILFAYFENENVVTASGFLVDSGNSYISVNQPSGQFVITGGTTITNNRVASKGVAVSIMEVPDNLDVNPFI